MRTRNSPPAMVVDSVDGNNIAVSLDDDDDDDDDDNNPEQ
jgi:hypothetical protein